jgi:hypothetical protein
LNTPKVIEKLTYFVFDFSWKQPIPNNSGSSESISITVYQEKFRQNFHKWLQKTLGNDNYKMAMSLYEIDKIINDSIKGVECSSDYDKSELDDTNCLGYHFNELYNEARKIFKNNDRAVMPVELTRHKLLCQFFPRNEIQKRYMSGVLHVPDYFHKRSVFHALYAFIKYHGRAPMKVINGDRADKYHQLYRNSIPRTSILQDHETPSFYIKTIMYKSNILVEVEGAHLLCSKLWDSQPDISLLSNANLSDDFSICINALIDAMYNYSYLSVNPLVHIEIMKDLLENVFETNTNEINAVYDDSKHRLLFRPFYSECIIIANLELRIKFYDFFQKNDWNTLCIMDENGLELYNLEDLYTGPANTPSHLKKSAIDNKKFYLFHSNPKPRLNPFKHKNKSGLITDELNAILNKSEQNPIFLHDKFEGDTQVHRMSLFLYEEGGKYKPKYGIYYFKPGNKVKINPVWFEHGDTYSEYNLNIMFGFFKDTNSTKWKL